MEDTNYTKGKMESLIQDLGQKIAKYDNLVSDLASCIQTVGQNWVEGDPTAMQLLESLKSEYNRFKATLDEMKAMMEEMKARVQEQVEHYQTAEGKIAQLF